MNRRTLLQTALFAPLAAASAVASVEKEKPTITATHLDPNCHVEVQISGYPDKNVSATEIESLIRSGAITPNEARQWVVIDEKSDWSKKEFAPKFSDTEAKPSGWFFASFGGE